MRGPQSLLGWTWSYLLRGWQGAGLQDTFLFCWGGVLTPGKGTEEEHKGRNERQAVRERK